MQYNRIVLNEPHASVEGLYDDRLSGWSIDARFLNEVVFRLTDWHTDYLFHGYRRQVAQPNENLLLQLWKDNQQKLKSQLCEGALLLDCHSFPQDQGDVDVCIGFNEDWSKPDRELLDYAVNLFEDNGYSVGINYPYSNSEAPACPFNYQSMMLEVNKRVYLEPHSVYLKTHCEKNRKQDVRSVVNQLLAAMAIK